MTRKTCTDHPHVDIFLQSLCREFCLFCVFCIENNFYCTFQLCLKSNGIICINITASMTRNKMPRTRNGSVCYKLKHSFLPTGNDFGPRLRTRKYTAFENHFVDTSGDDDSNHVKPIRELRSSTKLVIPIKTNNHDSDVRQSTRPKRTVIKPKRFSADERLVFDNRTYYKVQLLSNKLRSSGFPIRDSDTIISRKNKSPSLISEDSADEKNLIVKIRRPKNKALTILNNEAENFLFPHRDESNSDIEPEAVVRINNKKDIPNNYNSKICKNGPHEETSMDSVSSESSLVKKKRRLTQAEAFILDNQRYYKFETPGSRLRYQGTYLSPIPTKNNGEIGVKHTKVKVPEETPKPKFKLEDLKFSFEIVPETELWYKTFRRQDNGEECYRCYNNSSGYGKPFILPYELGPLPPLDPDVCVCIYNQTKKELIGESAPSTSYTSSIEYNNSSTGEDTKSSEDSECLSSLFHKDKFSVKRRRRVIAVSGKTPRKSPRQHASTLAILSSLIQHRKRREIHKARNMDKHNLSTIVEETKETPEPEPDYNILGKNIVDMLSNSFDDLESLDISTDGIAFDVHYKPDVIETLESYNNPEGTTKKVEQQNSVKVTQKPWRKKRKNRTGWPNKNKRTVFRKNGNNDVDRISVNNTKAKNKVNNNHNRKNKNCLSKTSNVDNKISKDVPINKLNGVSDNFDVNFKNLVIPKHKEYRELSPDSCAEVVVVSSAGDKRDSVNVDLDKWENAERILSAKICNENINNDIHFQPIVRVQKLDGDITLRCNEKSVRACPSPRRTRSRRMPASPKSPRISRRQRGRWYQHSN